MATSGTVFKIKRDIGRTSKSRYFISLLYDNPLRKRFVSIFALFFFKNERDPWSIRWCDVNRFRKKFFVYSECIKDGETDRQTYGRTDRQTDRQTYGRTDGQTGRQAGRQTDGPTGRKTDRQTYKETDRGTDRQTDRQTTDGNALSITERTV